ncbi:MAG: preprotein translocase subunit SecA, partial [Bdellovibrionota bacterium]|nr:preprotein translocase subunit SecA [Bdellovibrionota bacterium]
MLNTIKRIFGTRNDRELKQMKPILEGINKLEPHMQKLSDDELRAQTIKFREMIKNGSSLESILPEAFATVREASVRTLEMRHFDVQL